jgi:predicted permease
MTALGIDLRLAVRRFRREPSFAVAVVVTLTLALAATTVVWSLADAVVLRPLAFPEPDRLASVGNDWEGSFSFEHANQSLAEMADVASLRHVFDDVAAYRTQSYNLTAGEGGPERLAGVEATPSFFPLLGVPAQIGRTFAAGEPEKVVVFSHGLWQRRFGGDPSIVGRAIRLGADTFQVLGVMPPRFAFPAPEVGLWIPVAPSSEMATSRGWRSFRTIARLRPEVSVELAQTELRRLGARLREQHPEQYGDPRLGWSLSARTLHRQVVGDARGPLMFLLLAVGFVTLIACTNVANLFLARAARLRRELAVRSALGAGAGALLREVVTESVLLAAGAGLLGWLSALAALRSVLWLVPRDVPRIEEVRLDARVFGVVLAVAVASGLAIGVATFLGTRRAAAAGALRHRDSAGLPLRARQALVAVQTALALALLAGAGLVLRSLDRLQQVDPGYRAQGVTVGRIALDAGRYREEADQRRLFVELLDRLRARPEVAAAGAVSRLPLRDGITDWAVAVTGSSVAREDQPQFEQVRYASEGYFDTLGVPILLGRDFGADDGAEAPRVAIVSSSFARRYWPGRDPLEHTLLPGGPGAEPRRVVGVVGDVKHQDLSEEPQPTYYLPLRQAPESAMTVAVRARGGEDATALLRSELAALDPEQALDRSEPLWDVVTAASGGTRFQARVLGAFALLALALATVGTYSVVAYLVEQERRAFGIRVALGARRSEVTTLVLGRAAAVATVGLAAGLALSLAGAGVMRRFLYEVSPSDPLTLAVATLALFAAALLAAWAPARRAGRVDPIQALRAE